MAGCYPADNTHRHGVISDSRSLESFRQKQFPQRNTVSRLSDWLRGLVTPTLTYPMMHSRLCLIGSLSDSNDNEAECFLQDIVCFHVFGVNEFWITWSDDETFNQFEFFSAWICFFFSFKPSAGRVSVLRLSFIDWTENLPAADFRCINRVYRVCLLSAPRAAVSSNIDTYKTLFSADNKPPSS